MEDPELNSKLEEVQELHQRWGQFHDFFNMAIKGGKPSAQAEMKFLEIKTRIAMLHDSFLNSLKHDHKVAQNVMQILISCILLRRIPLLSNAEIQKIEFDWNECYLLMTETIANLEEERERIAGISERAFKMQRAQERMRATVHNFFVGPIFKVIVVVGVLGFIIFGVPAFGIYEYSRLRADIPAIAPVYDRAVGFLRRFNKELPYQSMSEIQTGVIQDAVYAPNFQGVDAMTPELVVTQLVNMGFPPNEADLATVKDIIARRKGFEKDKRKPAGGSEIQGFYFLFENSEDARKFVELRRKGVDALEATAKQRLEGFVSVARRANLVAIYLSQDTTSRVAFGKERWKFSDSEINL